MTPLVLGLLALALAGPVPAGLARVPALRRTPAAAMVLWRGVALAAVLSALGAGLSLVTARPWRTRGELVDLPAAVVDAGVQAGFEPVERCVALRTARLDAKLHQSISVRVRQRSQ